jgi:regulatory protein
MAPRRPPERPTEASLHEAALRHLARYAATEAALLRVLDRRIDRWARTAPTEDRDTLADTQRSLREAARRVAQRLREAGAVDDAAFAASRARRLAASGRSQRAIAAHLAARGAAADLAPPPDPEREYLAALITARRRRLGPFRAAADADADTIRRERATLARAGFPEAVVRRALATDRNEAETLILEARR